MWLIALIVIAVPLVLIGSLAFVRQPNRFQFALSALAFGLAILFTWAVFPWDVASAWLRILYPVLFLGALYAGFRRIRAPAEPRGKIVTAFNTTVNLALIVFFGGLCWKTLEGHVQPAGAIDLASPLRDGRFVIGHGGASPFINGHFRVRPQNYALDILGLDRLGRRMELNADPKDLASYVIFGAPLYSPCEGFVIAAADGLDDLVPPAADKENLAGNHVVVSCFGAEVVLAHLQKGSVAVSAGDIVTTGSLLGRVGNSGNTSEPHLHLHVEKGGEPGVILNGQAVPFTVKGRWLVRGSTF